jgi:hypothetical protein
LELKSKTLDLKNQKGSDVIVYSNDVSQGCHSDKYIGVNHRKSRSRWTFLPDKGSVNSSSYDSGVASSLKEGVELSDDLFVIFGVLEAQVESFDVVVIIIATVVAEVPLLTGDFPFGHSVEVNQ